MMSIVNGCDFHCHVDLLSDAAEVIAGCDRRRIVTLAVTTTPKAWEQNCQWAANSRFVFPAVGLHPELAAQRHSEVALLEELIGITPFIGEIGLDGSPYNKKSWKAQVDVFTRALTVAQRMGGRVVSIHSRRAVHQVLKSLDQLTTVERVLPILHWYSGSPSMAAEAVRLGCYFSINKQMLLTQAGALLIKSIPRERMLTETDAPFSDKESLGIGPCDVTATVELLAQMLAVPTDVMSHMIGANAERVLLFAGARVSTGDTREH